jgi:radical SAM protein with 4Fe4S-binding SPASM domain
MAISYHMGRKGLLQNALYTLRKALPRGLRMQVWRKTASRIFARRAYSQQVPLFRAVELETRTRCNSSCSFCAASFLTDKRPDIYMPETLYDKLLAELRELNYDGAIRFFVNNEPLLDKRIPDFIRKAKSLLPAARTEIHTNGLKLHPRSGTELLEAGLDLLHINNYSQEGRMHPGVRAFLDEVAPRFPHAEVVFHQRLLDEQLLNRGGTAPNGRILEAPLRLPCILPFDEVVVTADGRISICCQDHGFDSAVGNLNESRLQEIWYGPGFQRLRTALLASDRSAHGLCSTCDFRGFKEEHLTRSESVWNRMVGGLIHESR